MCHVFGGVAQCRVHVVAPPGLPATPQPETPHVVCECGAPLAYAGPIGLYCTLGWKCPLFTMDPPKLSPPPDVERLKMEAQLTLAHEKIAELLERIDGLSWRVAHYEVDLEAHCATLTAALEELYATVKGECPSLLNEDSGGSAQLDAQVSAALAAAPQEGKP